MSPSYRRPSAGFTLIELLTVIAIIGILAAIIIPTVGAVRITVQRSVEGNNLRTVGQAAITYANDNSDGRFPDPLSNIGKTMTGGSAYFIWMGLLAKTNAQPVPALYFSKIDKFYENVDIPVSVVNPDNKNQLNSEFTKLTPAFEFVGGIRASDAGSTPLGFTRGLRKDGTWDKTKGPYEDLGGHIVFAAGNMQFYKGSVEGLTNAKQKSTLNIAECIPYPSGGNQRIYGKGGVIGSEGGTPPDQAN